MKVPNPFGPKQIGRRLIAATMVASIALGVVALPAAFAEPVAAPVPLEALSSTADASSALLASLTSSEAPLVATAAVPAAASLATTPAAVVAAKAAAKPKKLTVRQIIAKVGREAGLTKAQIDGLMWIAKRESNFHPTSHSRSECHGLFQLSKGMAHGHPWKDPAWNTKRAIKYMRGRYGGVLQAKAFWLRHHWY